MTRWTALLLAASLAATAGYAAPPPPLGGTIALQPRTGDGDYDPSLHIFVDAVGEALAERGFTLLDDPNHAAATAELVLTRSDVGTGRAKAPLRKGEGVSATMTGGVSIPFSTGKSALVPVRRTRLELRIHRRGDPATLWTGSAVTVRTAGTPTGADTAVATDLTRAVLGPYPTQVKDTVGVP